MLLLFLYLILITPLGHNDFTGLINSLKFVQIKMKCHAHLIFVVSFILTRWALSCLICVHVVEGVRVIALITIIVCVMLWRFPIIAHYLNKRLSRLEFTSFNLVGHRGSKFFKDVDLLWIVLEVLILFMIIRILGAEIYTCVRKILHIIGVVATRWIVICRIWSNLDDGKRLTVNNFYSDWWIRANISNLIVGHRDLHLLRQR